MKLRATAANLLWRAACQPARRRLQAALADPAKAQAAVLRRLLVGASTTTFAREHGLRPDMSAKEFQQAVPVRGYDELRPWIERTMDAEPDVLFPGKALAFERSSGSTAAAKFLPLTAALRAEFNEAVRAWMADLFHSRPDLIGGPAWWVISPIRQRGVRTAGGIPIGLADDSEYLGRWERRVARALWAVPPEIAEVEHLDENMDWTLRFLLQEPELRLISVWNPSFLTLLWRRFVQRRETLLRHLAHGTGPTSRPHLAKFLRAMPRRAKALERATTPKDVWPSLGLISGWADAEAERDAKEAASLFAPAAYQNKGLLATEGVVTIPWGDFEEAGVPALNSHWLEFVDESGEAKLVHELEQGREYQVLLTTGGGLWRYRLSDRVHVEGRAGNTTRLRFLGRCDDVCDLRGEKLSGGFVAEVLGRLGSHFHMLAPCRSADPPHYILFTERIVQAATVDAALRANPHYAYARDVGQLGHVRVFHVSDAHPADVILRRSEELGQRAGSVKTRALHRTDGWENWFTGNFTGASA